MIKAAPTPKAPKAARTVKPRVPKPVAAETPEKRATGASRPWQKGITPDILARSRLSPEQRMGPLISYQVPQFPPGVVPAGHDMALDEQIIQVSGWANNIYNLAFTEGVTFLGYQYLSELMQRPEYRRMVEVIATEMTRKWIKLSASTADDGEDKTEKIKQLTEEMDRLRVRDEFRRAAELDSTFGRGHLFLDFGNSEDPAELVTPIGDGSNDISRAKIKIGSLKRMQTVEPIWTYPDAYNTYNPLAPDWYKPSRWFVQGTPVHASRLLTFVGREVPDMLKPSYSFGGLALIQMAKPYVDNWLTTRQSVNDIIKSFSVFILATDLATIMEPGTSEALFARADLFNNLRNNRNLMMVNKDDEDFKNVAVPLSSLDLLQAQAQEHMAAVSGIPLVKLLGIQPAGLNASSEGEIRVFYDWIHAYQELLFGQNLKRVIDFIQLSLWGAVDPDITFAFEPLMELDALQKATLDKTEAETDTIHINNGTLDPMESRKRIAADPESPYAGLDVDKMPVRDADADEAEGLDPDKLDDDNTEVPGENPKDQKDNGGNALAAPKAPVPKVGAGGDKAAA